MRATHGTLIVIVLSLLTPASLLWAREWHVDPNGTAAGDGSAEKPWSLKKAFNHPEEVKAGDTIWLNGGRYVGGFTSNLKGEPNAPIIVRQAAGERAIIDGNYNHREKGTQGSVLYINGGHTWYWGFEVMSSYPKRYYTGSGYDTVDLPWGIDIGNSNNVPGVKLINLVLHDMAQGPGIWMGATDNEMYGCLVFNNGYDADTRGHGHATYQQNKDTDRLIIDNIMFNQHSHGIHVYGSNKPFFDNFRIRGNMIFNNGAASPWFGYNRNILLGGGKVAQNPIIEDNYCYFSPPEPNGPGNGTACEMNYNLGSKDAVVRGNFFVAPGRVAMGVKPEYLKVMEKNYFVGKTRDFDPNSYPDNTYANGKPSGLHVFTRPNKYDPARTHICIYNWTNKDKVPVDVSQLLKKGDKYAVYDVQNYFGKPVASGTYRGKAIELPTVLTEVTPLIGNDKGAPKIPHTSKEFNVYVMIRQ